MNELILPVIVGVVLWALISILIIVAWYNKQNKKYHFQPEEEEGKGGEEEVISREEAEKPTLLPPNSLMTWQQKLQQLPGILGWILMDLEGEILESSDTEFENMGSVLSEMLESAAKDMEKLGIDPIEILEWDGSQGSILAAFPENKKYQARLVLFLGTESYKNKMREILADLQWEEPRLKGELVK